MIGLLPAIAIHLDQRSMASCPLPERWFSLGRSAGQPYPAPPLARRCGLIAAPDHSAGCAGPIGGSRQRARGQPGAPHTNQPAACPAAPGPRQRDLYGAQMAGVAVRLGLARPPGWCGRPPPRWRGPTGQALLAPTARAFAF